MLILLTQFERLVLEHLPCEPNGLSVHELADGLAGDRSPQGRARVRNALAYLGLMFAGLAVRRGDDDFGHADVELYGLRRDAHRLVRRIYAADAPARLWASAPREP